MKPGAFVLTCIALVALAPGASRAADRGTPGPGHPPRHPDGVPSEYVLTHHGFLHPSCVVTVPPGDILDADLVVRGEDGAEHLRLTPCAHPRFTFDGERLEAATDSSQHPHRSTWDGWIVYYEDDGQTPIPEAPTLTAEWVVPPMPTNVGQDIAFFDDIETSAGGGDILQPVLDFGESPAWTIYSEHYTGGSGLDVRSKQVVYVRPGDVIRGEVIGRGCHGDGTCELWTVTATDVTLGLSTVLPVMNSRGVPTRINPGVLEAYDVTSCDMLPPSGQETFGDSALLDAKGRPQPFEYALHMLSEKPAGLPMCGYSGASGRDAYRLIFRDASTVDLSLGGPGGCECTAAGSDLPHDWRVPAAALAASWLLAVLRLTRVPGRRQASRPGRILNERATRGRHARTG